jgi:hypothetical protein
MFMVLVVKPPRESVGVYSYKTEARLVPVYIHRFVVCTSDLNSSLALSVVVNATDAVVMETR